MYARVLTASLYGLSCECVWAEVDVENGIPSFSLVGLASRSIQEARDRIHSAVINCGFVFPNRRVTVNLTSAARRKDGSHFDLPIALSILLSTDQLKLKEDLRDMAFLGELTLDGRIGPVEGVLPMVSGLRESGVRRVMLPPGNLEEAALVPDVEFYPASSLSEAVTHLESTDRIRPCVSDGRARPEIAPCSDFAEIRGQSSAKRAAQIAAAGSHGLLMIGPPGVGKSMIGKRIPGILPPLSYEQQMECTKIYSVAGLLSAERPLVSERPFRSPHHNLSPTAMAGGGAQPRPGEISLAHNGVLFLDELPEFSPQTLESLRQPMEDGQVNIVRAGGRCSFPARFMLVAAMNPCRCGYYGDPVRPCTCSETDRRHYLSRISGPLLDRIDLHAALERPAYGELTAAAEAEPLTSKVLREGVLRAAEIQRERYAKEGIVCNAHLTPALIRRYCALDRGCEQLMKDAFRRWSLSARSYHRILRVARTVADLGGSDAIAQEHLLEALGYRLPDRFFR